MNIDRVWMSDDANPLSTLTLSCDFRVGDLRVMLVDFELIK